MKILDAFHRNFAPVPRFFLILFYPTLSSATQNTKSDKF